MNKHLIRALTVLLLALAVWPVAAERRMTGFDPEVHGFAFTNDFRNDFIREVDARTSGLCGGMVYAALDYYKAGMPITRQTYRPAVQTRLHDYIYDRQVNSLVDNGDKWAELHTNLFGWRNSEFFNWGLQGFGGGRLEELRAKIDRGEPVPLGLWHYGGEPGGDHQVLAIGYDTGRYRGDLGRYREELRIFVYDPNYPGETKVLQPDLEREGYRYADGNKMWLTYFVDYKYRPRRPPASDEGRGVVRASSPDGSRNAARPVVRATSPGPVVPRPAATGLTTREILLTIHTGGDDLRGGNDNVNAVIRFRGHPPVHRRNLNNGRRWIDNYDQTVRIRLPQDVALEDIANLTLTTDFGGGMGGDNWNVDRIRVVALTSAGEKRLADVRGTPLVRFTGQVHSHRVELSPPGP